MQLHPEKYTISPSDHRFAFPLPPTSAAVAGPQVDTLPNRQVDRDRLDVHNLADDLKVHCSVAADMLRWENSGFSVDASVRITLFRLQLRVFCQPLEHLLRYCARPPFALERLSVMRGEDGRIACVRYVLPRHKAANWVGPGRGRKSTRPGVNGVVKLSPFDFLDRLSDPMPPPRKHWLRYHGVFAPNHSPPHNISTHADPVQHWCRPTSAYVRNRYILFYISFRDLFL